MYKYTFQDYVSIIGAIIFGLLFALAIIGGMFLGRTHFIYIM